MLKNQADIRSKIKLEVIWWCFTIILAFFVMLPIMRNVPAFPFFRINAVLIILGVTFTRYIFLLKHSLIARQSKWKMVVIAAVLDSTVDTPAAIAEEPATAASPAAIPGAARPPVRANRVAPRAPAPLTLSPRRICSFDNPC